MLLYSYPKQKMVVGEAVGGGGGEKMYTFTQLGQVPTRERDPFGLSLRGLAGVRV